MFTEEFVRSIKQDAAERFEIKINDDRTMCIGKLCLLQEGDEQNLSIINLLTKWRQRFMRFFLSQFDASPQRTQEWLKTVVFPSPNRLLFLIYDHDQNPIGNCGLANIERKSCELDNLIRGEKGGHPRLIYFAERAMLSWLFDSQGMDYVNLHVFSNNFPTLRLHRSVGFKEVGRSKLLAKKDCDGLVSYAVSDQDINSVIAPFEYVEMRINQVDYYRGLASDGVN